MMPSFEKFDYSVRSNKSIERKRIFELVYGFSDIFDYSAYTYIGLGSIWFSDHVMAHRFLGVDQLWSIERSDHASRAGFNRPYSGISIKAGECAAVVASMTSEQWLNPIVAWFDFDGVLEVDSVKAVKEFIEKCAPNSIVYCSFNAHRGSYRPRPDSVGRDKKISTSVGQVENVLALPGVVQSRFEPRQNLSGEYIDISESLFPEFLADAISIFMSSVHVASGRSGGSRPTKYVEMAKFFHRDGAPMVTVGGMVCDAVVAGRAGEKLVRHYGSSSVPFLKFDMKPITLKEKLALDSCLPAGDEDEFIERATNLGLTLDRATLSKYRECYKSYPVYTELFT